MEPVPPRGLNYHVPMPASMKKASRTRLTTLIRLRTEVDRRMALVARMERKRNPGYGNCFARYSMNVVSCAPSSATNTAINSAGSVLLAFADTRCVEPGGSKKD
jgi:hypothetical protein